MFDFQGRSYHTQLDFASRYPDGYEDSSGVCSPPLWRSSPPGSPLRNGYRSLSPASRAQAIARGQKELMDMVRRMPDTCYELSLRDLVEVNVNLEDRCQERNVVEEMQTQGKMERRSERRAQMNRNGSINDKRAQMNRNGSINDRGFLLKMVFPLSLGFKKGRRVKRGDSLASSYGSRVSPRPSVSDASAKGVDNEWSRKKVYESRKEGSGFSSGNSRSTKSSGSSRSSSASSGRNNIRNNNEGGGCWFFLRKLGGSWIARTTPGHRQT